jgi:hypothetical protein
VRKAIEEIHRGEEHYDDYQQPAEKLGADRRHEDAVRCHHAHDDDTHRGRRQQLAARARTPEVMPLRHQLAGALPREYQHREDQRLQPR